MAFRKRLPALSEELKPFWDLDFEPDNIPEYLAPYVLAARNIVNGMSKHYYIARGNLFTNQEMAKTLSFANDDCEIHMVLYTRNVVLQPI